MPFGIRAIESGIEVDGVWISRGNTPAPSLPETPIASPSAGPSSAPDRTSSGSNISRLEIPQPAHGYPGNVGSRPGSASGLRNLPFERARPGSASGLRNAPFERGRPGSATGGLIGPFERGLSPEVSSTPPSSMASDHGPRGRPTYQPRHSSHLRFSNSQNAENSAAMAAFEGRFLNQKRNGSDGKSFWALACCPMGVESRSLTCFNVDLSDNPKDQSIAGSWSVSSSSENNDANQKSHDPERRSGHSTVATRFDTFTSQNAPTSNKNSSSVPGSQNSSISGQSQTVPEIRLSGVDNDWTAGTQFAEHDHYFSGPSAPLHEENNPFGTPTRPMEASTKPNYSSDTPSSDHPKPRFSLSDDEIELTPTRSRIMQNGGGDLQGRQSQVIRKINSGFEILRPGTLNQPQPNNETNFGQDLEMGVNSSGKKLHKKKRDSVSLRESRFIEAA